MNRARVFVVLLVAVVVGVFSYAVYNYLQLPVKEVRTPEKRI